MKKIKAALQDFSPKKAFCRSVVSEVMVFSHSSVGSLGGNSKDGSGTKTLRFVEANSRSKGMFML
jgi:hypothetical protein